MWRRKINGRQQDQKTGSEVKIKKERQGEGYKFTTTGERVKMRCGEN